MKIYKRVASHYQRINPSSDFKSQTGMVVKGGSVQPHFKPAPRKMSESSYKKYAWLVRDELMEAFKIAEADKKAEARR